MKRRTFLQGAMAGAALATGAARVLAQGGARPATRPNFVFILCDDLRKGSLGSEGHPFLKTPHIDRLAREGMTFSQAFVTTPVCSPSRATILTGQYPHSHGVSKNTRYEELSHRLITWPRLLSEAGYRTGYVGKWHMGQDDSPRPGFTYWAGLKGQGERRDPNLNINGQVSQAKGYTTDVLTDHAVEFLKARDTTQPFALYISHIAPHGPFEPAERHKTHFGNETLTRPALAPGDLEGKPAVRAAMEAGEKMQTIGETMNQVRMMAGVDEGVGRVLQALEESGAAANTVVVFTSDHGYFWGEHGLSEKRFAYDEALRVPCLVRFPKVIQAGSRSDALVQTLDFAPTFLELAGAPVPAHIQGRSMVPLLRGAALSPWRTSILAEFEPTAKEPVPAYRAVRTRTRKLISYAERPEWDEFYDLQNDPREEKNLIAAPQFGADVQAMRAEMGRLLRQSSTQAPAVTPLGVAPLAGAKS